MGRTHRHDIPLDQRLLSKRRIDETSGCWIFTGAAGEGRYAQLSVEGYPQLGIRFIGVHRLAHLLWIGPIPDGFEVHHREEDGCISKLCFNPAHLRAVDIRTHRVELSPTNLVYDLAHRTHCKHGHLLSGPNLWLRIRDGRPRRECLQCRRDTSVRANAKLKHQRQGA